MGGSIGASFFGLDGAAAIAFGIHRSKWRVAVKIIDCYSGARAKVPTIFVVNCQLHVCKIIVQ